MVIFSFFFIMDKINGLFFKTIFSIGIELVFLFYHGETEQALLGSNLLGIAIDVDGKVDLFGKINF